MRCSLIHGMALLGLLTTGCLMDVAVDHGGREYEPAVNAQPVDQTVVVGATAIFSVTAYGSPKYTIFQWKKGATAIPGATSNVLTLKNVALSDDSTTYVCVLSNWYGRYPTSSRTAVLRVVK